VEGPLRNKFGERMTIHVFPFEFTLFAKILNFRHGLDDPPKEIIEIETTKSPAKDIIEKQG